MNLEQIYNVPDLIRIVSMGFTVYEHVGGNKYRAFNTDDMFSKTIYEVQRILSENNLYEDIGTYSPKVYIKDAEIV